MLFDSVFVSIALITLGFIIIISIYDWVNCRYIFTNHLQKTLKRTSQFISLQNWEKAEKELSSLLGKEKVGKEVYLFEIQILRGKGLLSEALIKAEASSRLFPEELLFRFEEGQILLELKRGKEALESFQVCAPILRGESDLFLLASALFQANYPQECYDILSLLISTTLNGQIAELAGDALYELKLFPEAIAKYSQAIELGCETHHTYIQLGHAFRRLGNLLKAEKIFRGLLEKNAQDIDATLGLGACLQERGQHNKALLIYQTQLATKDVRLQMQAALAALRTKKYRFAEVYFFEIIKHNPSDPQILSYYGLCLENQKKWQEAEQTYLKLIQLFPDYYQGFRALAWMFGVGLTQTISPYQGMNFAYRALKLKNDSLSWEILSACTARIGNYDKAYQIQLSLAKLDKNAQNRTRRSQALRTLRKKMPLGDTQVIRTLVA